MGAISTRRSAISTIRSFLPAVTLDNDQLAAEWPRWTAARILSATGIRIRRITRADESAAQLGTAAADHLFKTSQWTPGAIDYLLYCTQSPDYFVPSTSCAIHRTLGLGSRCGAVDINQGCSGFIYALSVAKGLIESEQADTVLLITADTYSKYLDPSDLKSRALFGDGAAATIVTTMRAADEALGPFLFGTDGAGLQHLYVRTRAGSGCASGQAPAGGTDYLHMDGGAIFNFTIDTVPRIVTDLLATAHLDLDSIAHVVCHQANGFILEHLRERMAIPRDKFVIDMEHVGNTVSSTIPIALEGLFSARKVQPGARLMLVGFGAGYSWAGTIMTCHEEAVAAPLEGMRTETTA